MKENNANKKMKMNMTMPATRSPTLAPTEEEQNADNGEMATTKDKPNDAEYDGPPAAPAHSFDNDYREYTSDYADDYADLAKNYSQAYHDCMNRGPSNVAVLSDEWSGKKLPNCTFPFAYKGKIYYACTDVGYTARYWCANACDFSNGEAFHKGDCDIGKNMRGVLGTGVALNTLNIFVAFLFVVGFCVLFVLCLVELRRRRYQRLEDDGPADLNESGETVGRRKGDTSS